ncbi:MAG: hypothetical protein JST26_19010 [Bacteroidetes bacterium]|nr:hypothetical protein [Bacteroidota bacterium]
MKKHYFLLFLLIPVWLFSQTSDYSRYYNSWRLGLNIGAAWQTSDIRSKAGVGGGFTLEKGLGENKTNFFSFAIRGRYLAANTYGIGTSRNYDIQHNDALNGKYDPSVNFVDSMPAYRRYVYDNYKMKLGEGSLELQISFNRLREQTHVLLNLWGGVGMTSFRTYTNLKDADNKLYNFSKIDSSGNSTQTLSSLRSMYDKSYESNAYGSKGGNLITFSPSCGIGLGYQFSPGFSMLWEYKLTFPQGVNADLLDGKLGHNNDWIAGSKDYYHYTGINLLFTLRGKGHKNTVDTTRAYVPVYSNTVTTTNTVVPTNSVVPTSTIAASTNPPYVVPKPIVDFINPATTSSTVSVAQYLVRAQVLNVESASQIQLKLNAFNQSNFTFNPTTHILEYMATLNEGTNFVKIKATNVSGTDSKTVYIEYRKPAETPQGNPPQVTIVNPSVNPYTTNQPQYSLLAIVTGVNGAADIAVTVNGVQTSNFSYNTTNYQLSLPLTLMQGNNTIVVKASNAFGVDSKTATIIYQVLQQQQQSPPPVITYIDPVQNPYTSLSASHTVKAQVLNVSSQSQIQVSLNGTTGVYFTFDNNLKRVEIPVSLMIGSNSINITANNNFGSDSKSTAIIYNGQVKQGKPPLVTFVNPASEANSTDNAVYNINATVMNVASQGDITVTLNGSPVAFNFNTATKEVTLNNVALIVGNNMFTVSGKNSFGTDSKSVYVVYRPHEQIQLPPPVVTFIVPETEANATDNATYNFKASVTGVTGKPDITVTLNGNAVYFIYNPATKEVILNGVALTVGNNVLTITATNASGNDSKSVTVVYRTHEDIKLPPQITFNAPAGGNGSTYSPSYTYKATIQNISSASQLAVTYNNVNVTNFTFNNGYFEFTGALGNGPNTLQIQANNNDGSDTKSATVTKQQRTVLHPPVVSISQPSGNPTVSNPAYTFNFNVSNVQQNQVIVKLNGNVVSAFAFDAASGNGSFTDNLQNGANVIMVTATNNDGTDTKQATVTFATRTNSNPGEGGIKVVTHNNEKPPGLMFTNPAGDNFSTNDQTFTYTAVVYNITSASQLEVKFNSVVVTNFTFDPATNLVSFTTPLSNGANILDIKATNAGGSADKAATVTYPATDSNPVVNPGGNGNGVQSPVKPKRP